MNKFRIGVITLLMTLAMSCNFTEELHLEEDGSGKISINFDGSEVMQMAGDEVMATEEKAIDSVISFRDFLNEKKDSIATLSPEQQERLKRLEPFNLHMVMNPETGEMLFDMYSEFKDVSEVSDAFNAFQDAGSIGSGGQKPDTPMNLGQDQLTEVGYSFESNTFRRTTKVLDSLLHKQSLDSLQSAEMFLSGSTYTLKYHFPRKIKTTSAANATFSADGKTMFYEVGFLDYLRNPDTLNIEVQLED